MDYLEYDQPEIPHNQEILDEFGEILDAALAAYGSDPSIVPEDDETQSLPTIEVPEFTAESLKEVNPALYPSGLTAQELFDSVKKHEIIDRIGRGGNYAPQANPIRITCSDDTLWVEHVQPDPLTDSYMLAVRRMYSSGTGEVYFEAQMSEHRAGPQGEIEECNVLYLTEMGVIKIFGNKTSSDEYIIARAIKLEAVAREIAKSLDKFRKR